MLNAFCRNFLENPFFRKRNKKPAKEAFSLNTKLLNNFLSTNNLRQPQQNDQRMGSKPYLWDAQANVITAYRFSHRDPYKSIKIHHHHSILKMGVSRETVHHWKRVHRVVSSQVAWLVSTRFAGN